MVGFPDSLNICCCVDTWGLMVEDARVLSTIRIRHGSQYSVANNCIQMHPSSAVVCKIVKCMTKVANDGGYHCLTCWGLTFCLKAFVFWWVSLVSLRAGRFTKWPVLSFCVLNTITMQEVWLYFCACNSLEFRWNPLRGGVAWDWGNYVRDVALAQSKTPGLVQYQDFRPSWLMWLLSPLVCLQGDEVEIYIITKDGMKQETLPLKKDWSPGYI